MEKVGTKMFLLAADFLKEVEVQTDPKGREEPIKDLLPHLKA